MSVTFNLALAHDGVGRRVAISSSARLLAACALALLATLAAAAPAQAQATCTPGARIAAASYGHWYKATVVRPDGAKCWVHYDRFSSSSDESVTRDNLGPIALADQYDNPGGGGTTTAAAPARGQPAQRLVATSYTCSSFVGPVTGGGHMIPMPGLTILPGGTYRHQNGGTGRTSAANGVVEFHGGPLDGQAASYDAGPDGRRGNLHILNERRTRGVIDCDGHG